MTVAEMIHHLRFLVDHRASTGEQVVVIKTCNAAVPHTYMSPVKSVGSGFDWTANLFILVPEDDLLVTKEEKRPLRDAARARWAALVDAHKKLSFTYDFRTKRDAWEEGYMEGVKSRITSLAKEEGQ